MRMQKVGMSALMIQNGKGGIGKWVLSILKEWSKRTTPFVIRVYIFKIDRELFAEFEETQNVEVVEVSDKLASPVLNWLWHQIVLPWICLVDGLDAVHIPSYRRMPVWTPCPAIATIHDLAPFENKDKYDWKRNLFATRVVPFIARRMKAVIAVSKTTSQAIGQYLNLKDEKISVIYNGIEPHEFHNNPSPQEWTSLSGKYGLNDKYWLYVSRIEHPAKNHVRLIHAFEAFCDSIDDGDDWQLVFAGADWHGSDEVHERIQDSLRKNQIVTTGFIEADDVAPLYRGAFGLAFVSLSEGFGIPLIEGMACGTPVIASGQKAIGEVMGECGIRVDVYRPESIASAMESLASNSDKYQDLVMNGLDRANRFQWSQAVTEIIDVYRNVLNTEQQIEKSEFLQQAECE